VKEAFDPFNARKSHGLTSTNVLDLSASIKHLSEAVRFRLLPAQAGSTVIMPLEESWESTMTRAELLAYEVTPVWFGLVITLCPQTPKHIRGGWSHYTDTSDV
jgi:hypothetical protein